MANIHETSFIEDGAQIADDVTIGPFCKIGKDVVIHEGCRLESNIMLNGKTTLQEGVRVFSFTSIGKEEQTVTIGTKTHVREFVQIATQDDNNQEPLPVIIGANNFIMGYVQLLSGVTTKEMCILTNAVRLYENVSCEERVIIGGMSSVEANLTLGTGVMIGGASFVNKDMPPFTLVEGNPASVKGLNVIGLRRRLEHKEDMDEIKTIFKSIFMDGVNKERAKEIADTHANEYARRFATFIYNNQV